MKILVGNSRLSRTGGTETFTYAVIAELVRLGHDVEYFTFEKGDVSKKIEDLGVKYRSKSHYDLILANHNTIVDALVGYGYIIQTCHGVVPVLEQPSPNANAYVAISEEVQLHLQKLGYKSTVIRNGIDCKRFSPINPIHENLQTVLSLSYSPVANKFIEECCNQIGVEFLQVDKLKDNIWNIEDIINKADLVIGIGRSLYDSIACGRPVISFDYREYSQPIGEGYINSLNIEQYLSCNCSGRVSHRSFSREQFIHELQKYCVADGALLRTFAEEALNIHKTVPQYIKLVKNNHLTFSSIIRSFCVQIGINKILSRVKKIIRIFHELCRSLWNENKILRKLPPKIYTSNNIEIYSGEVIANSIISNGKRYIAKGENIYLVDSKENKLLLSIKEASDWRLMFSDSQGNIYVSPHSSINGKMSCEERGLYRLGVNSTLFQKVLPLYDKDSSDILQSEQNDDTIWTMCEDSDGVLYAGVYSHTIHKRPIIYRSLDNGKTWSSIYNFVNLDQQARHIHCIHYDKYQHCLYCLVGEINTLYQSFDKGETWIDLHLETKGLFYQKCTMITSTPYSRILGSDDKYNAEIYITYDDRNFRVAYQGWAGTIFGFRWSDYTNNLYAFTKIDISVENERIMPPIECHQNMFRVMKWMLKGLAAKKDWFAYYLSCIKRYPFDAFRPQSAAILLSTDLGETWHILAREIVGSESNYGFWTAGCFNNGCCDFGLVGKTTLGKGYIKTLTIKEL